jgi:hypothetical protein
MSRLHTHIPNSKIHLRSNSSMTEWIFRTRYLISCQRWSSLAYPNSTPSTLISSNMNPMKYKSLNPWSRKTSYLTAFHSLAVFRNTMSLCHKSMLNLRICMSNHHTCPSQSQALYQYNCRISKCFIYHTEV